MKGFESYAERVMCTVLSCTPAERRQGIEWYKLAGQVCRSLHERYDVPLEKVCAIMALLSPQKSWGSNVSLCNRALSHMVAGADVTSTNLHTKANLAKVAAAWNAGTFLELVDSLGKKAPKVRSFFWNMYHEASGHRGMRTSLIDAEHVGDGVLDTLSDFVTLDRHAIRVCDPSWAGENLSAAEHADMRAAYVEATYQLCDMGMDLLPYQTQAICWVAIRGASQ